MSTIKHTYLPAIEVRSHATHTFTTEQLDELIQTAVAAEREACRQIADEYGDFFTEQAIRARGIK